MQVLAGRRINFEGLAFTSKAIFRQNTSDPAVCQLYLPFPLNNSKTLGKPLIIPLTIYVTDPLMQSQLPLSPSLPGPFQTPRARRGLQGSSDWTRDVVSGPSDTQWAVVVVVVELGHIAAWLLRPTST